MECKTSGNESSPESSLKNVKLLAGSGGGHAFGIAHNFARTRADGLKVASAALAHPGVDVRKAFAIFERIESPILVGVEAALESTNDSAVGVFHFKQESPVFGLGRD